MSGSLQWLSCALFRSQVRKTGMLGGLPKPGTLILGPEKPGQYPTVPVRLTAEGTVRAKGERRRTPPPGRWPGRSQDPAPPAGNQAGPGRPGPSRPIWLSPEPGPSSLGICHDVTMGKRKACIVPTLTLFPYTAPSAGINTHPLPSLSTAP